VSDIPDDWRDRLDIREQIVRIDRAQAEIHKLLAERPNLEAETRKFNRDAWVLAFAALLAAFATIIAGVFARLPEILAAFGLPH
jgi:hypothetical protein